MELHNQASNCIVYFISTSKHYIGHSASAELRIYKHNHKHKGFTSAVNDGVLVYSGDYDEKNKALQREKEIKNGKAQG